MLSPPLNTNLKRTQPRGVQRPSCDTDPEGWTLDRGGLPDWLRAIRTCVTACPLIQQCWETRNRLYAESHPAGVIWAGTAYTETGEPLLTQQALVEYANWRRRRQATHRAGRESSVTFTQPLVRFYIADA